MQNAVIGPERRLSKILGQNIVFAAVAAISNGNDF
jgi:hypothetical protein